MGFFKSLNCFKPHDKSSGPSEEERVRPVVVMPPQEPRRSTPAAPPPTVISGPTADASNSCLLSLPPELRQRIWEDFLSGMEFHLRLVRKGRGVTLDRPVRLHYVCIRRAESSLSQTESWAIMLPLENFQSGYDVCLVMKHCPSSRFQIFLVEQ